MTPAGETPDVRADEAMPPSSAPGPSPPSSGVRSGPRGPKVATSAQTAVRCPMDCRQPIEISTSRRRPGPGLPRIHSLSAY